MSERNRVIIAMTVVMVAWAFAAYFGKAHGASLFPTQYDEQIQSATKQYWPDYPDWKFWKSQLWQESRLDPNAQSPVGAMGLAQMMPSTWSDIERALSLGTISRSLAGPAIQGGAYYMSRLRRSWSGARPIDDRHRLAQASYNAGMGSILKAQKICAGAMLWIDIAPCLPQVTGSDFSKQTTGYVSNIAKWRLMMN